MRTFYVCKATSKTTGKSYIGQTCRLHQRMWEHKRCNLGHENSILHREIAKIGFDDFEWEVLEETDSKEKALDLEEQYVSVYNTQYPNGYNETAGGRNTPWNWSRPVVCLTLSGEFVKEYKSAAEAERLDGFGNTTVLECCKGRGLTCKGHQFMFKDDYERNGSKEYVKPFIRNMTPVIQCDIEGNFIARYSSVSEASSANQIGRTRISSALIGCSKTAGGYIWVYEKDFPIKDLSKYQKTKKGKKVAQIDKVTGETIATFDRIADAGRALGVNYKGIHRVVDNPNKTAYGYLWKSIC